jgi:hypothetical protein
MILTFDNEFDQIDEADCMFISSYFRLNTNIPHKYKAELLD